MNNIDKQYQSLLNDILANGIKKEDRTGTGTISLFGRQIRHKMSEGFPLLTTKKMPFKSIVTELLWFLNGDTNIKYLVDNGCNIWNGDAYKNYCKYTSANSSKWNTWMRDNGDGTLSMFTQEEFVDKIKTDDEFAKEWGKLGPIYGKQWRKCENFFYDNTDPDGDGFRYQSIDQIQNLINDLKTNPDSRRLMVNAWNVGELDQMVLPPCHYGFQVYTRELSFNDRCKIGKYQPHDIEDMVEYKNELNYITKEQFESFHSKAMDKSNIPTRAISLMWNQRSVDTFLGLPFNIASYALLLEIIAREVNMVPDELIGNLGDVHLYSNHIEQAREQIGGPLHAEKRREMLEEAMGTEAYKNAVDELVPFGGGMSEYYVSYKIPYSTREPYPLPNLVFLDEYHYMNDKEMMGEIPFTEKINQFRPDFFKIENYQSHPTIKAPLSN